MGPRSHSQTFGTFKCTEKPLGFKQGDDIMDLYFKKIRLLNGIRKKEGYNYTLTIGNNVFCK